MIHGNIEFSRGNSKPRVIHKLQPVKSSSVKSSIFNFSKETSEVNIDDVLSDPNYLLCGCGNLPYVGKNHLHVVTRHIWLIDNSELCKLFCQGICICKLS